VAAVFLAKTSSITMASGATWYMMRQFNGPSTILSSWQFAPMSGIGLECGMPDSLRAEAGEAFGDASDLLGLSADERRFVEVKLVLADGLRLRRTRLGLTQTEVARRVGSSQSRVAKMEAGDPTVSTDLLLRSLFRLGAKPTDVARLLNAKLRGSSHLRVCRTRSAGP
jgi:DNA-binding XRE family transcriptional regulator